MAVRLALASFLAASLLAVGWLACPGAGGGAKVGARSGSGARSERAAFEMMPPAEGGPSREGEPPSPEKATPAFQPASDGGTLMAFRPRGCALVGVVLGPDGALIPGSQARVRCLDPLGRTLEAIVADDGAWRLTRLEPGTHWLSAGGKAWEWTEVEVKVPPGAREVRVDFVLEPRSAPVTLPLHLLTPGGKALHVVLREAGVRWSALGFHVSEEPMEEGAVLEEWPLGVQWSRARDEDGRIGTITTGSGHSWVSLLAGLRVLDCIPVSPSDERVVFVVDPERLRTQLTRVELRVLDRESGLPVPAVSASLFSTWQTWLFAKSSDGVVVFPDVPPGPARLTVRSDHTSVSRQVVIEEVALQRLPDLLLESPRTVRGRVVDADGLPVVGAVVSFCTFGTISTQTGPNGFFVHDVGRDVACLYAKRGRTESEHVPIGSTGPVDGLELVLNEPAVIVLRPRTELPEGASWSLHAGDVHFQAGALSGREPRRAEHAAGPCKLQITAEDGTVLFELDLELEPGQVHLVEI